MTIHQAKSSLRAVRATTFAVPLAMATKLAIWPVLLLAGAFAAPPSTVADRRITLDQLGVVPGSARVCAAELQQAIDLCHARGGGTVVIPAGVFTIGSIRLKSHVALELEMGAVLAGSADSADYPVQNIGLRGVPVELGVAGQAEDVGRTVPELENSYPEGKLGGRLPAYGFFVRHASRGRFEDVVVKPASGEPRPSLVTDDLLICSGPEEPAHHR